MKNKCIAELVAESTKSTYAPGLVDGQLMLAKSLLHDITAYNYTTVSQIVGHLHSHIEHVQNKKADIND